MVDTAELEDISPIKDDDFKPYSDEEAPYGRKKDGTPAKRRGRPAGYTLGPRGSTTKYHSLKEQLRAFLTLISAPLRIIPSLQKDALDNVEIEALATAIDQQCQTSPAFRKYVEMVLKGGGSMSLVGVIAIIGGRRILRHDLITVPEELGGNSGADVALGAALSTINTGKIINSELNTPEAA